MKWIAKNIGFLNCCTIYFWLAIVYLCIKQAIVGIPDALFERTLFGICILALIGGVVAIGWLIKIRHDMIKNGVNPQPAPKLVIIIEVVMMVSLAFVLALPYLDIM